ncbi:MAG: hypothetical protein JXR48_00205 [Candidatus Delongbacteria bacterium]|nr:hypothetical protein [Candidatus Delongbacteria bacterium]
MTKFSIRSIILLLITLTCLSYSKTFDYKIDESLGSFSYEMKVPDVNNKICAIFDIDSDIPNLQFYGSSIVKTEKISNYRFRLFLQAGATSIEVSNGLITEIFDFEPLEELQMYNVKISKYSGSAVNKPKENNTSKLPVKKEEKSKSRSKWVSATLAVLAAVAFMAAMVFSDEL